MKAKAWICIAWKRGSSESVCKRLKSTLPIDQTKAMSEFKQNFPGFRNYTVQPDTKSDD